MLGVIKSKLVADGFLVFLSKIIQQAGNLFLGVWLAKHLSEGDYGTYRLLLTIIAYIPFTNLGIPQTLMYKLPSAFKLETNDEVIAITSVFTRFLITLRPVLFILFLLLAFFKFELNHRVLGVEWLLVGVLTLFSGWNLLFTNLFRAGNDFKSFSILRILNSVVYMISAFYLVKGWSISGVLFALVLGNLVAFCFGILKCSKFLQTKYQGIRTLSYIRFGFPMVLSSLVWILFSSSILWITSAFYESSDTGIYGFALVVITIFKVVPDILLEIVSPRLIAFLNMSNSQKFVSVSFVSLGIKILAMLNMISAIFSILLFKVLLIYYVPKYESTWPIIIFLIIGNYVYNLSGFANTENLQNGKALKVLGLNIASLLLQSVSAVVIVVTGASFYYIGASPALGLICSSIGIILLAKGNYEGVEKLSEVVLQISIVVINAFAIITFWYLVGKCSTLTQLVIAFIAGVILSLLPALLFRKYIMSLLDYMNNHNGTSDK